MKAIDKQPKGTVAKDQEAAGGAKTDWQEFVDSMERSLLGQKAEIVENLIAGNNDFREVIGGMDAKDIADVASDDIDRQMIEAIGSQEVKRLKLIDSAVARIRQGRYGLCSKCGMKIPKERLLALPYALMCVECKSKEERRAI